MKKLLFSATALPNRAVDAAWLLFRLHVGLSIADGAGWPKLPDMAAVASGSMPGPPQWFVQQVAGLGFTFPSPSFWAGAAVYGEFMGGLLIALGLFTRWSGLQLSFQFFVVAFLWYQDPSPITGMYFQQLLFWSFVVITAVGPGRFSLDYLLIRSRKVAASESNAPLAVKAVPKRAVAAVFGLGLLVATACYAGNGLNSNLFIEPGSQFVLGGEQRGAFSVAARNVGRVPVEIKERTRDAIIDKGTLAPGRSATLRFMKGNAAVIVNNSAEKANLRLKVTGDTQLGMRNEALGGQ